MKTTTVPVSAPKWLLIDATGLSFGRLAAEVATLLRGKHKPSYSPHQLCGDQVVIINAEKLGVSAEKKGRKTYFHHTGHLGHTTFTSLGKMMEDKPEEVIRKAVYGMLPRTRLRLSLMRRLHIFRDAEHPYAPQKPVPYTLAA